MDLKSLVKPLIISCLIFSTWNTRGFLSFWKAVSRKTWLAVNSFSLPSIIIKTNLHYMLKTFSGMNCSKYLFSFKCISIIKLLDKILTWTPTDLIGNNVAYKVWLLEILWSSWRSSSEVQFSIRFSKACFCWEERGVNNPLKCGSQQWKLDKIKAT